ncbi:unnamed protein product [Protopolystoma xenopodis]|uniref:K Homology domain-containing protein n=1 Tax=Protopolystoma xenopodis TaxID=117903 RepID=A0A3S5BAB3_9PLAT|nr:unnamed protein product [Protopolystoma xenopodis]
MANIKEITMPLPPPLLARLCDRTKLPLLRSIREQCSDVDFRFPHVTSGSSFSPSTSGEGARGAVSGAPHNPAPSHVIISGPPDALEKAERLLADMNAKVAEMCEECVLNADPKYHGFLIGRQGTNIAKFRDSHRVHLIFPERGETDPKLASEIRIIGQKAEVTRAKAEMEVMIKQLVRLFKMFTPRFILFFLLSIRILN